jgi:hypothetical protein
MENQQDIVAEDYKKNPDIFLVVVSTGDIRTLGYILL